MNLVSLLILITGAVPAKTLRIDLASDARVVRYENAANPGNGQSLVRGTDGYDAWIGPDGQYMIALEWDEPRDLAEVNIEFRHAIANRAELRVQYWQENWPAGKGQVGSASSETSHGHWTTAKADWWAGDRDVTFAFLPYSQEQPGKDAPDMRYRRTRRLLFQLGKGELPPVRYLRAYGPAAAREVTFDLVFDAKAAPRPTLKVSIVNGDIMDDEDGKPTATRTSELQIDSSALTVRYAANEIDTPDRTLVKLRADGKASAEFIPAQVIQRGQMDLPSLHASVSYRPPAASSADSSQSSRPSAN